MPADQPYPPGRPRGKKRPKPRNARVARKTLANLLPQPPYKPGRPNPKGPTK